MRPVRPDILATIAAPAFALATGLVLADPSGFAVNSRGFADEGDVHVLWRVDLDSGETERIGRTGYLDLEGLALAPDGTLYGADDESKTLVTVNTASGFSTAVGSVRSNMGVSIGQPMDFGMTFTCDGELLVSSDTERSLFVASLETGRLERIGEAGSLGAPITDIAAFGDQLYGIGQGITGADGDFSVDAPNLYRIDRDSATTELIGSLGQAVLPYANAGLAFDADGRLWALTDRRENGVPDIPSEVLRLDLDTGRAAKTADAGLVGFESLAIAPPSGCDERGGAIDEAPAIPATGPFGRSLMILMLMAAALWSLARRP
jgi:sugar lactone lactonase YvrE